MDPQVAIVVVSYNTRDLLLECLASVVESTQDRSAQLLIDDNSSEDGTYEAIREAYPHATAIRNSTNLGCGAACNQGFKATDAPFILLLNSDARLTAQAFHALCDCLEQNERCGAAGCKLIDAAGAEVINTRNFLTPLNQAFELTGIEVGLGSLQRTRQPKLDRNLADCSVDWIDGACLMLRRAALDEAGFFDERFFMYSEDEDLCFRLKKRGWLVCFCGAGTAVHHGAASSRLNKIDMLRQFYLSQMLFLLKHHGAFSAFLFAVAMRTVLVLKRLLLRDGSRREAACEHLQALREASLSKKQR
jgi:GT2 family glycosyltransferase